MWWEKPKETFSLARNSGKRDSPAVHFLRKHKNRLYSFQFLIKGIQNGMKWLCKVLLKRFFFFVFSKLHKVALPGIEKHSDFQMYTPNACKKTKIEYFHINKLKEDTISSGNKKTSSLLCLWFKGASSFLKRGKQASTCLMNIKTIIWRNKSACCRNPAHDLKSYNKPLTYPLHFFKLGQNECGDYDVY